MLYLMPLIYFILTSTEKDWVNSSPLWQTQAVLQTVSYEGNIQRTECVSYLNPSNNKFILKSLYIKFFFMDCKLFLSVFNNHGFGQSCTTDISYLILKDSNDNHSKFHFQDQELCNQACIIWNFLRHYQILAAFHRFSSGLSTVAKYILAIGIIQGYPKSFLNCH